MPSTSLLPCVLIRICNASTDIYALGVSVSELVHAILGIHIPTFEHPISCLLMKLQTLAVLCTVPLPGNRPSARQVHSILTAMLA